MNPLRWVGWFLCQFRRWHLWRVTNDTLAGCDATCRLCGHTEHWAKFNDPGFWARMREIERQIREAREAEESAAVSCRYCREATMHAGDVCYACAHAPVLVAPTNAAGERVGPAREVRGDGP